jgi:hypothetical protein
MVPGRSRNQEILKELDSGFPPAFAGVARNDDLLLLLRILPEA